MGFFWGKNKQRPFFDGHEREDVVKTREIFVKYFYERKQFFDIMVKNEKESKEKQIYSMVLPLVNRRTIIAHDETTFRSGEVQAERWLHHQYSPFFSKGRGVSKMVSDFITSDPILPVFELNDEDWYEAVRNEPWLEAKDDLEFLPK